MNIFIEPLQFEFFRNALMAGIMVGALAGLMGVFIVLRGLSYIGHGLSHAAFGGAVIGAMLQINFYVAGFATAGLAALIIQKITDGKRLRADAAIGIVTTALFALGVALIGMDGGFERSFEAALFGNILGVTGMDLGVIAAVTLTCFAAVGWWYRGLLFAAFDEETAAVFGVPVNRLRLLFSLALALAVCAGMNIVGVTMIVAALVVPAASLRMLTNSFHKLILGAPPLGATIAGIGLFGSYHLDTASGATIVLAGTFVFGVCWALRLWRARNRVHAHLHRHGTVVHAHTHGHQADHAHDHELGYEPGHKH